MAAARRRQASDDEQRDDESDGPFFKRPVTEDFIAFLSGASERRQEAADAPGRESLLSVPTLPGLAFDRRAESTDIDRQARMTKASEADHDQTEALEAQPPAASERSSPRPPTFESPSSAGSSNTDETSPPSSQPAQPSWDPYGMADQAAMAFLHKNYTQLDRLGSMTWHGLRHAFVDGTGLRRL